MQWQRDRKEQTPPTFAPPEGQTGEREKKEEQDDPVIKCVPGSVLGTIRAVKADH